MIRFSCETCGRKFKISDRLAGRKGVCPDCHEVFSVPSDEPPQEDSSSPLPSKKTRMERYVQREDIHDSTSGEYGSVGESSSEEESYEEEPAPPPRRPATVHRPASEPAPEPVARRVPEPARGGVGWGVIGVLALLQLVSVGYIWKLGGFGGAAPPPAPQPASSPAVAATTPKPPTLQPPKPTPPMETPAVPPKEEPPKPTPPKEDPPAPVTPPKEEPPTPTPPKEDPPPHVDPPPTPPKEDPPPPAPPSHEDPPPTPTPDPPVPQPPAPTEPAPADVASALEQFKARLPELHGSEEAQPNLEVLDLLKGYLTDAHVVQTLGEMVAASTEPVVVRKRAAQMLGEGGSAAAVDALVADVQSSLKEPQVSRAAVYALGKIADPSSAKALEAIVRARLKPSDDLQDNTLARHAITSLGQLRRREAVDSLLRLYESLETDRPAQRADMSQEEWKREGHIVSLETAINEALSKFAGESYSTYQDWTAWWSSAQGTFQ